MITRAVKQLAIVSLVLAIVFWDSARTYQLPLRFVVSLSAFVVARQAWSASRQLWGWCFFLIALLFNPFVSPLGLGDTTVLALVAPVAAAFAFSIAALKTEPLLSIPSITDGTPRRESL